MVSYLEPKAAIHDDVYMNRKLTQSPMVRIGMLVFCILLGIFYVIQISSVSTKGYDIASLQKEIRSLEEQNQRLAVEIAKNSSIPNVQARIQALQLVRVDKIDFLKTQTSVARR